MRAIRRGSRGQTLAEFAIAIPVFLLVLLGLLDVGRAVYAYNALANGAREGGRLAIVNQDVASIQQRVASQAVGVATTTIVAFHEPGPEADAAENDECQAVGIGCIAVVQVTSEWRAITPVVGSLIGPIDLGAETQMPVEFACPNAAITGFESASDCPKQP